MKILNLYVAFAVWVLLPQSAFANSSAENLERFAEIHGAMLACSDVFRDSGSQFYDSRFIDKLGEVESRLQELESWVSNSGQQELVEAFSTTSQNNFDRTNNSQMRDFDCVIARAYLEGFFDSETLNEMVGN